MKRKKYIIKDNLGIEYGDAPIKNKNFLFTSVDDLLYMMFYYSYIYDSPTNEFILQNDINIERLKKELESFYKEWKEYLLKTFKTEFRGLTFEDYSSLDTFEKNKVIKVINPKFFELLKSLSPIGQKIIRYNYRITSLDKLNSTNILNKGYPFVIEELKKCLNNPTRPIDYKVFFECYDKNTEKQFIMASSEKVIKKIANEICLSIFKD